MTPAPRTPERCSALYVGRVRHERHAPRRHAFGYRLYLLHLDLDELEDVLAELPFASARRPAPLRFRRADYLGDPARPLKACVLDRVEHELGRRPTGAVRMLTHLRALGYVFNPVTFYYCHDADGALDAVVAEITNTPWRERHAYVLDARTARRSGTEGNDGTGGAHTWRFPKTFHVSPFFDMDHQYTWSFTTPGERLGVHMTNHQGGAVVFHAGLELERRPLTAGSLLRAWLRHPFLTHRVHLAIYLQALRLWLKRTPFFPHPDKRVLAEDAGPR